MEEVPRHTSLVPLASPCSILSLLSLKTEELFRLPGAGRGSFPLCGGTFARHIRCRQISDDSRMLGALA